MRFYVIGKGAFLEWCGDGYYAVFNRADAAELAPILAHFAATGEVKGGGE